MQPNYQIRLLSADNNRRGDLFTRLIRDLFFALGYENLRLNVHKAGRELDLQGAHRLEPRKVLAECKAHSSKMGGSELNKFFGVLARERKKAHPEQIAGYFVSLGGFTETGVEQENETDFERLILLDAQKIVQELERSRVIVSLPEAAERAGQCAQHMGLKSVTWDGHELLGHDSGYIWAIYYSENKDRKYVSFVHADGTPLGETGAADILIADKAAGGTTHKLTYILPPITAIVRSALENKMLDRYRHWIGEECGFIQLDGLPADADLSATRLKLERLFVPLRAVLSQAEDEVSQEEKTPTHKSVSVGELLEHSQHLAFLAKPGGGKSTLVKRLATAYAFPSRLKEVADGLPERDWLPLILRCRELRDRAHRPFVELIDDIPRHVGLSFDECCALRNLMHARLQTGRALLLIDGLDEISEEGARHIFANNLRSFLAMFPQTAVVVTSREAGFRLIAGVVASACEQVKLAPLNKDEVVDLCERWHAEVVADTEKVRTEARQLGNAIWRNRSIRTLTENPLLLTTLLVVKRSAGELPRNRTSLYREAIRVLVRTWNVEGYAAMDESETLAQLSYVACAMMEEGTQQVGEQKLLQLLKKSRRELEAELQFAEISPQNFMERIEYRSSLLMQTGHARVDGILEPVYEFRHLTFQEYLAALGYVEEHYQGREDGRSLTDVLGPYLDNERWREVISLAAVLAKRKAEDLVKRIISCAQEAVSEAGSHRQPHHGVLLYKCLIDEVQLTAPTLKEALRVVARQTPGGEYGPGWATTLLQGRFGARFQELVEEAYISGDLGFEEYLDSFMEIALYIQGGLGALVLSEENRLCMMKGLKAESRVENIRAAMVCMLIAYQTEKKTPEQVYAARRFFDPLDTLLRELLASGDMPSMLAASWAFAWIGERKLLSRALDSDSLLHLYNGWVNARTMSEGRIPGWAFSVQSLLPRDTFAADIWGDCSARLQEEVAAGVAWGRYPMNAFIIGWYRRRPWTDEELVKLIRKQLEPKKIHNQVGHDLLRKINEERKLPLRVKRRKKIGTH